MPPVRISQRKAGGTCFTTMTVKNGYYVLDRYRRWNILADSLKWFLLKEDMF